MIKSKLTTAAYTIGALLALSLSACSGKKEQKAEVAAPVKIETITLAKEKIGTSLQLPGELIAFQQVDLYAKVNSFVKDLKVDIGSEVQQGQLLVSLEAPELTSQLAAAQSRLMSQEAIYTSTKASYDRLLETSKTPGTVSQNDLDIALAKRNSDKAQFDAAKAFHKEISTMIGYLEIRAPFAGVISSRNINPGAYVGSAGKGAELPLFTLQEQKKLRLAVAIPEAYTSYLKTGDEVKFRVRSLPSETFTSNVKRKAGALDLRLRSERVEMDVVNNNKKLLPGMVAEISLNLSAADSTFFVPKTAVVNSAEGIYVIRVDAANKTERVPVKKGREAGDRVEVFGALNNAEALVLKGSEELKDGTVINR